MEFRFRKKRLNPFIPQVMVIRSYINYDIPSYSQELRTVNRHVILLSVEVSKIPGNVPFVQVYRAFDKPCLWAPYPLTAPAAVERIIIYVIKSHILEIPVSDKSRCLYYAVFIYKRYVTDVRRRRTLALESRSLEFYDRIHFVWSVNLDAETF